MDQHRLTAIPIFSELSDEEANRLAAFATETSLAEGDKIVREGDFSTELIAIEEGTARVVKDGEDIATLGPGALIGEIGLLRREPRMADVVATSPVRITQADPLGDPKNVPGDAGADRGPDPGASCAGTMLPREAALAALEHETFDVVVIGGGITGAGVALDAASRGYSVALCERADYASGTSSRSSKLVHGGLRYLQNFDLGLVREALLERQLLVNLAPHLVRPLKLVVPAFERARPDLAMGIGLNMYDVMATRRRGTRRAFRRAAATGVEEGTGVPSVTGSSPARRSSSSCPRSPLAVRRAAICSTTARPTTSGLC